MSALLLILIPFLSFGGEEPLFKKAESKARWLEATATFEKREYRAAGKVFTSLRRDASDKASADLMRKYANACKGGERIPRIEKEIARENWKRAWAELGKLNRVFAATPLAGHLEELHEVIFPELFLPLADFEEEATDFEKVSAPRRPQDRSKIVDKKEFVTSGKRSLQWRSGGGGAGGFFGGISFGSLPLAAFEGTILSEYRYLNFSIFSTDDNFGKFTVYFGTEPGGPNSGFAGTNILRTTCFIRHITVNKTGWNHFRIDLRKEMTRHADTQWEDVTGLALLTVPPSHPKLIYIDDVRLEVP